MKTAKNIVYALLDGDDRESLKAYLARRGIKRSLPTGDVTYEDWVKAYRPVRNPFEGVDDVFMLETFGRDFGYMCQQRERAPKTIWTAVSWDDGGLYVVPGYRFVNRTGYYITEREWQTCAIQVCIEEPDSGEEVEPDEPVYGQ